MFNISRSIQPTLGIDISNSSVRVLQLSAHKQRYRIEHIGSYPIPEDCISERVITNIDSVAQCVKKQCNNHDLKHNIASWLYLNQM